MKKTQGTSDLLAGVLAALTFGGLYWWWGIERIWLSVPLTAMIYLAVRFLTPTGTQSESTPEEVLGDYRTLCSEITDLQVRQAANDVAVEATNLLRDLDEAHNDSKFVVGQYLQQAYSALQLYLSSKKPLARRERSTQEILNLLGLVKGNVKALHDAAVTEDDNNLAQELSLVSQNLQEMDKVFVNLKQENQ